MEKGRWKMENGHSLGVLHTDYEDKPPRQLSSDHAAVCSLHTHTAEPFFGNWCLNSTEPSLTLVFGSDYNLRSCTAK